jgi:hypothetical protein
MVTHRQLNSGKKILWILAAVLFWPVMLAGQVQIIIQMPPPGQFNPEDFIHLISFQNNGSTMQTYMTATVEEENSGIVFSGKTAPFELGSGFTLPHYSVYEPITVDYVNEYYRNYVLNSNSLPSGSYVICCRLYELPGNVEVGYQCVPHTLFRPSAPVLIFPVGEVPATGSMPVFQWLPPAPLPPMPISYRIQLAEVLGSQLPEEALTSNPPLMEWNTDQTLFSPSAGIFPLTEGKHYAWRVQALSGILPVGENEGFSEAAQFTWGTTAEHSITPLSPVATCVGEVNDGINSTAALFQWMATGDFVSFQVVVTANACGRFPKQKTPPSKPGSPDQPSKPVSPPVSPPAKPKPPVTTPANDTVKPGGNVPQGKPPVFTHGGQPDTTGGGVTVVPVGGGGMGITHWPDEDEGELPALPPGWEWGPSGPRWTGEYPPPPPDLPPGWEWEPLRPVWTGKGSEPVNRKILKISDANTPEMLNPDPGLPSNAVQEVYNTWMHLDDILKPGQAFVYQVYGIYNDPADGKLKGCLSEPQCLRYEATADGSKPQKAPCQECVAMIKTEAFPPMDGGLDPPDETLEIPRDGFVTLKALGADFDQIFWYCTPKPDCPETPSTDMRPTSSRVRFTWEIISGEGDFVQIGCSGTGKTDIGNRVIFMPPYVKPDSTKETRIKLSIIDDNPSQATDNTVVRIIILKTSRKRIKPDLYKIEITSDKYQLPTPVHASLLSKGTCLTDGPYWTGENDLKTPEIILPGVKDAQKLVCKEQIRLTVKDLRDPDNLRINCKSSQCNTLGKDSMFEDDVDFEWRIVSGGGAFIKGKYGRTVVYEASGSPGDVVIEVQAFNPSGLKIIDKKKSPGKITLKIYQPGIKLEQTPADWLPKHDNHLEVTSSLMYEDMENGSRKWKPALAHQCAIHHLELIRVSKEPGICLNWPYSEPGSSVYFVDHCPDLTISTSEKYELYDTVRCKRFANTDTLWFLKAASLKPDKIQKITINCYDYGAYGFLKSSARNPYIEISWTKEELSHPVEWKQKFVFNDSRITIPRDVDTNKIADAGYYPVSMQGIQTVLIKDSLPPWSDNEAVEGNTNHGDGISAYEEYRGFRIQGTYRKLNPYVKNILIWDRDDCGFGYFGHQNTGIAPIKIKQHEFDTLRIINKNRNTFSLGFDQKGIRLFSFSDATAPYGGVAEGLMLDTCEYVWINRFYYQDPSKVYEKQLVAHEISHALGALHHGEGKLIGKLPRGNSITIDRITSRNDTANTAYFFIACPEGITSGDKYCWMRYPSYAAPYCIIPKENNTYKCPTQNDTVNISGWQFKYLTADEFGRRITNTRFGTESNSSGNCAANSANGRGNCFSQLRVRIKP